MEDEVAELRKYGSTVEARKSTTVVAHMSSAGRS